MLKGHTRIELTNVHTGEKEITEKHNMITNFLSDYANRVAYGLYYARANLCPLYETGMGGIILLSDNITEDANSYKVKYNSMDLLTGCAFNGVNTGTSQKIGSKNSSESMILDNGYKYVWDFGTNQANGIISALGLCNSNPCVHEGSAYAYPRLDIRCVLMSNPTKDLYTYLVDYDFENNVATFIKTVDTATVTITKMRFDVNTIHLRDSEASSLLYISAHTLSSVNITAPFTLNINGKWEKGFDGYYYYIHIESTTAQHIARMSKDAFQIDTAFGLKNFNAGLYNKPMWRSICIANGYLYLHHEGNELKKINLSNLSEISSVASDKITTSSAISSDGTCMYNCGTIIFPDDGYIKYNYKYDTSYDTNLANGFWQQNSDTDIKKYIISNKGQIFGIDDSYLYYGNLMNSLCTINNLDAPVTKTADKTMKIIYTLTES